MRDDFAHYLGNGKKYGYLQSEVGIVFFLVAQKLNHRG